MMACLDLKKFSVYRLHRDEEDGSNGITVWYETRPQVTVTKES